MDMRNSFALLVGEKIIRAGIKFRNIKKWQCHLRVRSRLRDWPERTNKRTFPPDRESIMNHYSPQLIQTMRDALDAVMTQGSDEPCNAGIKGAPG